MSTDFLIGITIGASVAFGLSIGFVLFCLRWAKTHRDPIEHFHGDWK